MGGNAISVTLAIAVVYANNYGFIYLAACLESLQGFILKNLLCGL